MKDKAIQSSILNLILIDRKELVENVQIIRTLRPSVNVIIEFILAKGGIERIENIQSCILDFRRADFDEFIIKEG